MDRVDILKGLSNVIDKLYSDLEGTITSEDEDALRAAYQYILKDQQTVVRASINKAISEQTESDIRHTAFHEGYKTAVMDILDRFI